MFKNKKRKFLFSLFALPLLASYSTFLIDTNKSSITQISSDYKSDIKDTSINYEDAFPVVKTSIKSLSDYIVAYEDNNIYPVNVNNATIGMTYDFTTLTYTTYGGVLLWSSDLTQNPLIKKYYSSVLNVNNIGAYKVNNFAYQKSTNLLFVLFGNKDNQNQIIFAIDIYTGMINIPSAAYLKNNQIIGKVADGSNFIFFNSTNEVIVTSCGSKNDANTKTKVFSYSPQNTGFTDKNLTINLPYANEGDLLISIVPGFKGTNYGYYVSSIAKKNNINNFGIAETSSSEFTTNYYSYDYYIYPLNDDLTMQNRSSTWTYATVNNNGNNNFRFGYISGENRLPDFNNIYKRIFRLENASSQNSSYMFALIDGYYKFLDSYTLISDSGTYIVSSPSKGFGSVRDSSNDQQLIAKTSNFNANEKVAIDSWKFNNFGYDNESNLLYFSFSGKKINTTNNQFIGYMTKLGYLQFESTTLSLKVSDFTTENSEYNLYSVGFDSYSSSNYYMGKQLDHSNPIWLARSGIQNYAPTANNNITFSNLTVSNMNLIQQIEDNSLFKQTMPENISNTQINEIISSLNINEGNIKITKQSSSNQSGLITLQVEITQTNNFGDSVANGNTQYVFKIDLNGYSLQKDFIFKFITTDMVNIGFNDKINKINEIKESTGPSSISKTQVIDYFLDANILDKNNNKITIEDSWITLKPNDELGYLTVEANLPEDLFPIGFPKENLSTTAVYKDFWVHVEPLPPDPKPSDNNSNSDFNFFINKDEGEKVGIISGVVVGITLICLIIF
ncbi:MAG: hypothetical protein K2G54_00040, partial [Malacoplasma sp.]|nr:hypothetical protein [Malacoplasma sp.]